MKILNLIQCTNLGGMEQASLRLMRGLMDRGHTTQLLSLNPIGQLGPLLAEAGIPHEGLPYLGKGGWRSYGLVRKKLKTIQADGMIMTGHHLLASLALGDICKGHRILAIHFHHEGVKSRLEWQMIYRIACNRFNAITFPCDFIRNEAEKIFPPVRHLAHTIRNPLHLPALPTAHDKAEARKALGLPLARPIIGNAGWLIPRKRFDLFIHTAREIINKNRDALFVIAGNGSEEKNLKQLVNQLGMEANFRWLGWLRVMRDFYKVVDVLLFNSDWDAFPTTPLEAMSYGVPVVCSVLNGGLVEVLDSKEYGFLISTHNLPALASQVLRLIDHPDEAAAIGLAGRKRVQNICDPGPIVEWHEQALCGEKLPHIPKSNPQPEASLKSKKTALIFHRVGPYHFARTRAAGRSVDTKLIEVFKSDDVYDWDPVPGADGFERTSLFDKNTQATDGLIHGIRKALDDCRPDVVAIPGWADTVALSAIQWCAESKVPVIVMSETTEWDEPRWVFKEWIKRKILRMCAAGLVGGQPHAEYLARLGMPHENIFQGYDAVDNEYFERKSKEVRNQEFEFRNKFGLSKKYFLDSARFIPKKNLLNLIRAYAQYREMSEQNQRPKEDIWDLVLLGDGPLKSELSSLITRMGLQKAIQLPGFKQYGELPTFYALASVFIHPSTVEQWGLVVNEAMASGLPILVSNRCGCAQNLVQDGVNGFNFDPYNPGQMADLMFRISDSGFPLADFGAASSRIIAEWSPDRFAKGFHQAIEAALAAPRVQLSALDRLLLKLFSRR